MTNYNPNTRFRLTPEYDIGNLPWKIKKPLSNQRIIYIHPASHQLANNYATEPYIQYTVTTNKQQPADMSRNIKHHNN